MHASNTFSRELFIFVATGKKCCTLPLSALLFDQILPTAKPALESRQQKHP